jgi:hypothetical protein
MVANQTREMRLSGMTRGAHGKEQPTRPQSSGVQVPVAAGKAANLEGDPGCVKSRSML